MHQIERNLGEQIGGFNEHSRGLNEQNGGMNETIGCLSEQNVGLSWHIGNMVASVDDHDVKDRDVD